nr:nucleolar complex protein 3 homolog [Leptinotarsa decemlineata]
MLQMVEEDDIEFLKTAITNRSYNIFNRVRYRESVEPKPKKRKIDDDETLENEYEDTLGNDDDGKKVRNLLPIKTKKGVIPQQTLEDVIENDTNDDEPAAEPDEETESSDIENFTLEDSEVDLSKPVSAAQLLATRNEILRQRKIHIGTLSSGLLENPEEKVTNLRTLLTIMDEEDADVYLTIRKLVIVSLLEVFKDILPSYEIKKTTSDGVKMKKDTLKLHKYEENLLLYYKKFLQKLEKYCFMLMKKKGDTRKRSEDETKLGVLAVQAMCDLLVTHPYFNFSQNIAQAIVPFMNNGNRNVRDIVKTAVKTVFKEDKKEEITLKIMRVINNYLKNHSHIVHTEMLEVLLNLNLREVNLDQEKEQDMKQKKLMSHKSRLLQMSKKERKRKKKLKEVEKELLETKAEENKQTKQKNITEITKLVFNIYFRILKLSSNTKILGVCLEGLAKFAHCINLEFYVDIVNVLDSLLKEDWLGYREKLHCIQTVFAILSGQGEALNLDPIRFYNSLYKDLLFTSAASRKSDHIPSLLKTLSDALIKRRKKITNKRTIGFVKRIATLSLQMTHDGTLGCLGLIRTIMQLNRPIDILLDLDNSVGEGKFQAEIDDPEYSNAASTALYEMILLNKHYHPIVTKFARNIASGVPATGEGSLPGEYGKSSAEQLFTDFNMSEMSFNPPVPIPTKEKPKTNPKRHNFADSSFERECKDVFRRQPVAAQFWISI